MPLLFRGPSPPFPHFCKAFAESGEGTNPACLAPLPAEKTQGLWDPGPSALESLCNRRGFCLFGNLTYQKHFPKHWKEEVHSDFYLPRWSHSGLCICKARPFLAFSFVGCRPHVLARNGTAYTSPSSCSVWRSGWWTTPPHLLYSSCFCSCLCLYEWCHINLTGSLRLQFCKV